MTEGQSKRGRGRPRIEITVSDLEALGELACVNREIAAFLGVSERTIEKRLQEPELREALARGEARANVSLRRKQLNMALNGDRTMLIWLGKQRLGQKDKIETDSKVATTGPPPIIEVTFVDATNEEEA